MGRSARKPAGFRDVDGILLLDKPLGVSSNRALQQVRFLFQANKAGHTGSLDPLATGMLPICFGEATKFSGYLIDSDKSYRADCQLGVTTTTGDTEGDVIETCPVKVNQADIEQVLTQYRGAIEQTPPMYSAIKVKGQRLYKLARQGLEVERQSRSITINNLTIVDFKDNLLRIEVGCSKGTYIRTLAEDIGKSLGCGAHLTGLHRIAVHPFWQSDYHSFESLTNRASQSLKQIDELLLPIHAALTDYPEVSICSADVENIKMGRVLTGYEGMVPGLINLMAENVGFMGLAEVNVEGQIKAKRLMNTSI
ncbi:MAG: tRNA pseudouridine55 synthase [Gammaproteobacteria bacterium]|jgi:tRNA pseudouridine55 synthase